MPALENEQRLIVPGTEDVASVRERSIGAQITLAFRCEPCRRFGTLLPFPNQLVLEVTSHPVPPQFKPLLPRFVLREPPCQLVKSLLELRPQNQLLLLRKNRSCAAEHGQPNHHCDLHAPSMKDPATDEFRVLRSCIDFRSK